MTQIACPHCGRVGSSSKVIPDGATVRCPGCSQRFTFHAVTEPANLSSPSPKIDPGLGIMTAISTAPSDSGTVQLDDGTIGLVDLGVQVANGDDDGVAVPLSPRYSQSSDDDASAVTIPPEPWYYGRLVLAANIWIILTYVILGLGLLITLIATIGLVAMSDNRAASILGMIPIAFGVLISFVVTLFTQIGALLILLGVDAARNLRIVRFASLPDGVESE